MPILTIDLNASLSPADDLRAINECYSAINNLILEGGCIKRDSMSEIMILLESLMKQSINNLDHEAEVTPEKTEQELTDISEKLTGFVQDKKYFKYLSGVLSECGQSVDTLPVSKLLENIDSYRVYYEQGEKL